MSKVAYWINDTQWVCPKHIPSARIPESEEKCWYNCGTIRPAKKAPPLKLVAPVPAPAPAPLRYVTGTYSVVPVAVPPPPPPEPEMVEVVVVVAAAEEDGPSPQERRRGATYKVACLECGTTLWRRKKDVEEGTKPFCTPAHRGAYEIRVRQPLPSKG